MKRRIIQINQDKCNGCGLCVDACHEGAIGMKNGKATLMRDDYCDGLGDCLPTCPTGAITFVERDALPYDEEAVKANMAKKSHQNNHQNNHQSQQNSQQNSHQNSQQNPQKTTTHHQAKTEDAPKTENTPKTLPCGCPSTHAKRIVHSDTLDTPTDNTTNNTAHGHNTAHTACQPPKNRLSQWPVQIKLVPPIAPYFENANLLICADCTAYAYANFHETFIKNHITLIGCPKLDATDYAQKLTDIIKNNNIKSVKVVRMEVPCCGGIVTAVKQALIDSQKFIPWQIVTISTDGKIVD